MIENEKKDLQDNPEMEMEDTGLEPRVYEIGYTLLPTIREEDLDKEHDALLAHIIKLKGEKISEEKPKLISLAYEMSKVIANKREKFSQGYFGWIKFYLSPKSIEKLDELVEKTQNILRYILIKTEKENTIYSENSLDSILQKKQKKEEPGREKIMEQKPLKESPKVEDEKKEKSQPLEEQEDVV